MLAILILVQIVLQAPEKTAPADVQKAAKALEKRLELFGFEGVKTTIAGRKVTVAMAGTWNAEIGHRVELLGLVPGKKVEVRFLHPMTEGQRLQYTNLYGPEAIIKNDPPKGSEWALSIVEGERATDEPLWRWLDRCPLQAYSPPTATKGPHLAAHKEESHWRYEVNVQLLEAMMKRREQGIPSDMQIVADGYVIGWLRSLGSANKNGTVNTEVAGPLVSAILSTPLSVPLVAGD